MDQVTPCYCCRVQFATRGWHQQVTIADREVTLPVCEDCYNEAEIGHHGFPVDPNEEQPQPPEERDHG
jgi:hypothetical protein